LPDGVDTEDNCNDVLLEAAANDCVPFPSALFGSRPIGIP